MVYTPKAGQYSLQLHAVKQGQNRYTKIGNYLIKSDRACADLTPFPKTNSDGRMGAVGGAMKGGGAWVEPVSHVCPLVEWRERGEMSIRMKILQVKFCIEFIKISFIFMFVHFVA